MIRLVLLLSSVLILFASLVYRVSHHYTFDLVVYGGTPAGITSAISASRKGLSVGLLLETEHLGGMMTSGLSHADTNISETIGGISKEFFARAAAKYKKNITWSVEPHIAEQVFRQMLDETGVVVFENQAIDHVYKDKAEIKRLHTLAHYSFVASTFIDASYEGDLLARAAVSYVVGREGKKDFHEHHAGKYDKDVYHQFPDGVSPYDSRGELLPFIQHRSFGEVGEGDPALQAYNFRFCWTEAKENRVPFWKPKRYKSKNYELLARVLRVAPQLKLSDIFFFMPLPNQKYDVNNRGPFSTDFIGMNWDYPDADYSRRKQIWQEHKEYTEGLLYFLVTDRRIPAHIQQRLRELGHCRDEFARHGHWPPQLYVREARRMRGEYIFTEHDLTTHTYKKDSVALGSSGIETHYVRRFVNDKGWVKNEGYKRTHAKVFEIPYRSLLPKRVEAQNLIVPICLSASEVGFSAIRMEPVYMALGQAAGTAASLRKEGAQATLLAVQDVEINKLQAELVADEAKLHP